MKYFIFILMAGFLLGCENNPYEGLGPLTVKADPPAQNQNGQKLVVPAGEFKFVGVLAAATDEGKELIQKITISDADHPQGPFQVFLDGFPAGTWFQVVNATTIEIHFKPGYDFVIGKSSRLVEANLHVLNPDSRFITGKIQWTINDTPVAPLVAGPEQLLQASVINFSLIAENLNGDTFPKWKSLNDDTMGKITVYEEQMPTSPADPRPRTEADVVWTTIPPELAGKNVPLKFQACVGQNGLCTTHKISVQLPSNPTPAENK